MRYWSELATYERDGFTVVVEISPDDTHPSDCMDETAYDMAEICRKIDQGIYTWFVLRVRVLLDGHEFGRDSLGGMLYEDPKECLTDGVAEDCIFVALEAAWTSARNLKPALNALLAFEQV